jgi:hypothetical protein
MFATGKYNNKLNSKCWEEASTPGFTLRKRGLVNLLTNFNARHLRLCCTAGSDSCETVFWVKYSDVSEESIAYNFRAENQVREMPARNRRKRA